MITQVELDKVLSGKLLNDKILGYND